MTLEEILEIAEEISCDRFDPRVTVNGATIIIYVPYESGESFLDRLGVELGYDPRRPGQSVYAKIDMSIGQDSQSIAIVTVEVKS